jgi:hypothetical protein
MNPERTIEYLDLLVDLMRQANAKARDASNEWEKQNTALNDWLDDHRITDPVQREKIKRINLGLAGAEATWSHWEREAKRYQGTIMAEESAAKMRYGLGAR